MIGLPCLVWGNWPASRVKVVDMVLTPKELALPGAHGSPDQPAPKEGRRLLVDVPSFVRLGDDSTIKATLEVIPQASGLAHPDLYLTHNLVAETRLEVSDMLFAPGAEIYSSLRDGIPTAFSWDIRPTSAGLKNLSFWLHLQYVPPPDPLEPVFPERKLLAAPEFQIKVISFLGMAGTPVRVIGGVCTVLGSILLLSPYLQKLIGRLFSQDSLPGDQAPLGDEPHA
jgi:hypothetical protein